MKASEIIADKVLKSLLDNQIKVSDGVNESTVAVYCDGERSTTGVPEDFIEIEYNGSIDSMTLPIGVLRGYLMVSVFTKLFSDDTIRSNRVQKMVEQIEGKIDRVSKDGYFFMLDPDNVVTPATTDLTSGYSFYVFNIKWRTN